MSKLKIFRFTIYLLMFLWISHLNSPYSQSEVNPKIEPYYNEFMALVYDHCKEDQYFHTSYRIDFDDLSDNAIGVCYTYPNSFKIKLDRDFWNSNKDLARFQLISHELTHCMFLLDHTQDDKHYMNPVFVKLSKEELYKQIEDMLKRECKN